MTQSYRVPGRGRIRTDRVLRFTFDGDEYTGHEGDTLASALLANGVHHVTTSGRHGRPRGIVGAGVEEPNALVQLEKPWHEPMLPATTVELTDGLAARSLRDRGRLESTPDPGRYDRYHAHCDVLVVGAGPAGLHAARTAALAGARVMLIDDQPEAGGHLLTEPDSIDGAPALDWVARVTAQLTELRHVTVLPRTTAIGYYDGLVLALQKRTDHLGAAAPAHRARQRVWRIRARQIILATGAQERPIAFADNDRPGIMLASAARTYLNRYGVLAGTRVAVFTTNDSAYAATIDLADAGAQVAAVVDARPTVPLSYASECVQRGIDVRPGHAVIGTGGQSHLADVRLTRWPESSIDTRQQRVACDLLLVSGGWNPAVHLFSHAGGPLRYDPRVGGFVPEAPLPTVRVAGAARGLFTLGDCLADAAEAGAAALATLGRTAGATAAPQAAPPRAGARARAVWSVLGPDDEASTAFVDLQRDATVADVRQAVEAGLTSVELVKRYTTIGTAHDQGRTSGLLASGVLADTLGVDVADLGLTTFRPPYTPVLFAALAGRDRGELYDQTRLGPLHSWHADHGAVFQDVGQWKRPRYYPLPGEDMAAAVARECRAAREGVALTDASTLGKIVAHGPDAATLLDLVYTNLMSSLRVGRIRYGVMCRMDGTTFDDGTVTRLADDEYLLTTTTGHADAVLGWLEEWLQTEWPHLRVRLTAVTDQWATLPLVGPRARDVLAELAGDLDVTAAAFPFMTWRDATVAGVPARVCRISFSGELAYEINVSSWYARRVWQALLAAGQPYGITPYGLEATHVLRAEKGYPIIGQDSDATTTPHDLGLSWAVSTKKADFLGKRSFSRAENLRADRRQLVALLPADPQLVLPEGAQIVDEYPPSPPSLGHVTSSYHSAALGRSFALGLLRAGRDRIGDTVFVPLAESAVPVQVAEPVLYDKENVRRDS